MKRISSTPIVFILLSLFVMLESCGSAGSRFKLKGRFLHFNQGTFLVYTPNGEHEHIDTISVEGGRFAYETDCESPYTMVLVMPNFSEVPIFAKPGGKIKIEADASHLDEMEIEGTKDNELMTAFRRQVSHASPPEKRKLAADFIKDHAKSPVAEYLLNHYFVATASPDYSTAMQLVGELITQQPENSNLKALQAKLKTLVKAAVGQRLGSFSATDINGRRVSSSDFMSGVGVIYTWATWNFESYNMQRQLRMLSDSHASRLHLLGINLDVDAEECRSTMKSENISYPQICDGLFLSSPVLAEIGLSSVPDNIVVVDGKIVARGLDRQQLAEKINQLIN